MTSTPANTAPGRIGAAVAAELTRHRVSRATAAAELGLSTESLRKRVTGVKPFDVAELDALALLLGIPVTTFVSDVRPALASVTA